VDKGSRNGAPRCALADKACSRRASQNRTKSSCSVGIVTSLCILQLSGASRKRKEKGCPLRLQEAPLFQMWLTLILLTAKGRAGSIIILIAFVDFRDIVRNRSTVGGEGDIDRPGSLEGEVKPAVLLLSDEQPAEV